MRVVFLLTLFVTPAYAGLHLSLETVQPLPANWKGFVPDHRRLRGLANINDTARGGALAHSTYADAILKLENKALSADEAADLGALYLRTGQVTKAIGVLRKGRSQHPNHFALAANLGTAWQMAGDLENALLSLDDAVELAPADKKANEEYHRTLVRSRLKNPKSDGLDTLFDKPNLAAAQQLALWLPADGRLLWQVAEQAYALSDVRAAANLLDSCVAEFGMGNTTLRERRTKFRAEADALEEKTPHASSPIAFKSPRALGRLFDEKQLPKIDASGVNPLPWAALAETEIKRPFKPAHLKYVESLDGKRVSMLGHFRPGDGKASEITSVLLTEYPVGCWFCETPDPAGLVQIEFKSPVDMTRDAVRVEGVLRLNRNDPESYLFRIEDAAVKVAD